MIAQLIGRVVRMRENPLVLDVHGVGYAVFVVQKLLTAFTKNQTITLFTHTHVREDTLQLFGFLTEEELGLFDLLLSVSGIGPKTALAILDRGVSAIRNAIVSSDVEFFMAVPRLGKKNAQKIIIELRSKVAGGTGDIPETGETGEIMNALLSMGFERKEVKDIVKKLPDGSLELKIREALRLLGKR